MPTQDDGSLRFYLNNTYRVIQNFKATDTLLSFLRETCGLVGTKEGCKEGGCGACTVLMGRVVEGQIHYQAVNACILFLPLVHNTHIITIEAIGTQQTPHPLQHAIAQNSATQCGFCTPGIVMSLYAAWLQEDGMNQSAYVEKPDKTTQARIALQGNLCRCTGYVPIINAYANTVENPKEDPLHHDLKMTKALQDLPQSSVFGQDFCIPFTRADLLETLETTPKFHLVCGGTDLGLALGDSFGFDQKLVFIHEIPELHHIKITDEFVTFGSALSYTKLQALLGLLSVKIPDFIERIGGAQIRNLGSIGGNIANGSPVGDMPPVLMALGGEIMLSAPDGSRVLALGDYFLDYKKQDRRPKEFIEKITLPRGDGILFLYKISKRHDEDISSVVCAFYLKLEQEKITTIRIAFGGMAKTPKYAKKTMAYLEGRIWNRTTIKEAQDILKEDFNPISDVRASADYRMKVAQNCLLRAYEDWNQNQ